MKKTVFKGVCAVGNASIELRARFTKQGKVAFELNPQTALIGVCYFLNTGTVDSFQYQLVKMRHALNICRISSKLCVANISKCFCAWFKYSPSYVLHLMRPPCDTCLTASVANLLLRSPCKHLFYTKTQFMEQHVSKSGPESVSSSHLLIVKCSLFIDSLIYSGVCLTESPFQDFTPKGNN